MRSWLHHLALSLLIGLLVGVLGYLGTRALTSTYLLYQQQQFVQETLGVLRGGGVESLAGSNLRELRQHVQSLEARYQQWSLRAGMALAGFAAVASYLWMERQGWKRQHSRSSEPPAAQPDGTSSDSETCW
jgi:hypothetical protein